MNSPKNSLYEEKSGHYYNAVNPNLLKHIKRNGKKFLISVAQAVRWEQQ
ncbi:hypothetical protein BF36_3732 [Bacillus thuringiensis]|nr:hypothetical protein BF36_3732 [Bacillus thuringiensis]